MTYTPIGHPAVDRPEVSRSAFGYLVVDNLTDLDSRVTTNASGKADKTTTVSAGTGLTGGGDLSANRTLTVAYGTTAGTATQGNDTRVANAVQTSRLVTAGTGLTGGGDLSADRTLTVAYGNTSTTAASGDRALALENIAATRGRWYISDVTTTPNYTSGANVPFVTADGDAASGMTLSTGVLTITNTGDYSAAATVSGRATGTGNITVAFVHTSGASTFYRAGTTQAITATGDFLLNISMSDVKITAADTIAVNLSWSGITTMAKQATGFVVQTVRSTNFGIDRIR